MRRRLAVLVVALGLSAGGAALWSAVSAPPRRPISDVPVMAAAPAPPRPVLAPSSETAPQPVKRPVDVPADPYAPEPIRELGTIEIPKLGLVHRTWEGVTLNNIDLGPSHWPGSAMPGEPGNAVFAGHRVTHGAPFQRIDELIPGDVVVLSAGTTRATYRVTGHEIVTPDATWIADQTPGPTATIYACHPPNSATYRYVVRLALDTVG